MELKVFTLPTCSSCSVAKRIAFEVAQKYGITYREINMAANEGMCEGLANQIISVPSIAIDEEVIVKGRLISKEKLEEEVKRRVEKWKAKVQSK